MLDWRTKQVNRGDRVQYFTGKNEGYKHSGRGRDLEMLDYSHRPSVSDRLLLLWVLASYEDRLSVFYHCFHCGYCIASFFSMR